MIKMGDNKQEHTAQEGRGCGLYRTYLKRILDIVLTSAALVVFLLAIWNSGAYGKD